MMRSFGPSKDVKNHRRIFGPVLETEMVLDRVVIEWLFEKLTAEEAEILRLWSVDELTLSEIGEIVGPKYRGRVLAGSTMQYHKDRAVEKLRQFRDAIAWEG